MYPEGYLRQQIREDGWQENPDEILDRDAASIARVLSETPDSPPAGWLILINFISRPCRMLRGLQKDQRIRIPTFGFQV
jgi:hypothetical protein